jgi:isopenicillin N synthase-like dioxygenase
MTQFKIPTLDISRFENDKQNFAVELGKSYQELGFCGIVGHGVNDQLLADVYAVMRKFFDLPVEVKKKYHVEGQGGARGYTGFGVEVAKDNDIPDLKEFWHMGREIEGKPPHPTLYPNLWPEEIDEFKPIISSLYNELEGLGKKVLRALAIFLGENENYFEDKIDHGNSILRPLHYPPVENKETPAIRAGAHEDINFVTVLCGSHQAGLEVLSRNGEFIPAIAPEGTIVINIGDMLQRLSNNVLPSTTHRVVNPVGEAAKTSRLSVPFFLHPNPEFLIETLPGCITEKNPNHYPESITANDYLLQRLKEIGLM